MQRSKGSTEVDPDAGDLACAHGAAVADHLREGLALDALHPDPDFIAIAVGTVDDHHV